MNDNFVNEVEKDIDELKALFLEKNNQYSVVDPLANFRTGAMLQCGADGYKEMYEVLKNYMGKHVAHVYNNGAEGVKVEESLHDIAVYCLIGAWMCREHRAEELRKRCCEGANADDRGK